MELDGRRLKDGALLEADVCIVGAGPAGLVVARELVGSGTTALVLESGSFESDDALQQLNEGTVDGDAYVGLRQTRHRQVGGTVHTWNTAVAGSMGAKYVPLDPWDFHETAAGEPGGWPFLFSELLPYYERAQIVCGLGPFRYQAEAWSDPNRPCFDLGATRLASRVYQLGQGTPFTRDLAREIAEGPDVTLCHGVTVTALDPDAGGTRLRGVTAMTAAGTKLDVRASAVVLAGGAVENARLLLVLGEKHPQVRAGRSPWIGRCFMEHPRDHALTLFPSSPDFLREAAFYDTHAAPDGTLVCGRIALTEEAVRDGLPNASITLLPRVLARKPPGGRAGRLVQAVHEWGGRLPGGSLPARVLRRLHRLFRAPAGGGYGWSDARDAHRFDAFRVVVHVEQRPHAENRIVLGPGLDAHGVPRVTLRWRWRDEEQQGLLRLRSALADWLEGAGLGRVEADADARPDPNAHHHAGTTRMHVDPEGGVVDPDARVHGAENLYVAGASAFPTAGFANPMLTIVALSLRLADHLKTRTRALPASVR